MGKGQSIYPEIKPGEQAAYTISAMPGGFAHEVLKQIAHPSTNPDNKREFGEWKDGICTGVVCVSATSELREVVLLLGKKEGLFLDDTNGHKKFSLKHECSGGLCTIPMHGERPSNNGRKSRKNNALSIANNVVGSWVIHGRKWWDRAGKLHYWPYGIDERKEVYNFEVVDGSGVTFTEAVKRGIVRSVHPGTWKQSVTVVPAAMGVSVILHEFEERADGKNDVTSFGNYTISNEGDVWGPYAKWAPSTDISKFGKFRQLAEQASSPFAFHVAATRKVFPNCTLASTMILESLGEEKLLKILDVIAEKDPERFYRLIDKDGVTHKLLGLEDESLVYSSKTAVNPKAAAQNVLETFRELARLETDPAFELPRKTRLVLDSHFYVVVFGILTSKGGATHHLGGTDMHRYLTSGSDALMHRSRNERLFDLVKTLFGVDKLKFHIYPSVALGLPGINQYNFDPGTWDPSYWTDRELST